MPGPLSGNPYKDYRATTYHSECRNKERCKGPGCRIHTGKTGIQRRKGKAGRRRKG